MMKAIPSYNELVGYGHAVAGHDGVLSDVNGELFIKPCTSTEIEFYETTSALHPEFMEIMPTYLGRLALDEKTPSVIDEFKNSVIAEANKKQQTENSMAASATETSNGGETLCHLEPTDLTLPDLLPNKSFGTKINTKNAVVLDNTSFGFRRPNILDVKLGVRLWADDAPEAKRIRFEKITAESTHKDLGFRIAGMRIWQGPNATGEDIDEEGYKIYDKTYGRSLNKDNIHIGFRSFIHNEGAGMNIDLANYIGKAFLKDVIQIQSLFESHENRMFSASLLFVYEGDVEALKAAIEQVKQTVEVDDESDDSDHFEPAKIYSVKLIDFAHAEWTPGQGPDENTLVGIRSVAKILNEITTA